MHDPAGEGRVTGDQRTAPSSPCVIQLIASRGVSLSAFFVRWATFIWSHSAHCRPAQCTCPPPSAASRPHLRNRGESTSWPHSYHSMREREDCGARSVRSCDGRKSYDHRDILPEIFEIEIVGESRIIRFCLRCQVS